jgi:hypothetical protein
MNPNTMGSFRLSNDKQKSQYYVFFIIASIVSVCECQYYCTSLSDCNYAGCNDQCPQRGYKEWGCSGIQNVLAWNPPGSTEYKNTWTWPGSYPSRCRYSDCLNNVNDCCLPRCPPGQYTPDCRSCVSCPVGTYKSENDRSNCITCSTGYYCPSEGSTSRNICSDCKAGMYETRACNSTHDRICSPCPNNYYQPNQNSINCINCPLYTVSPQGANSSTLCVASAGYYGQPGTQPTVCPKNSYCPLGSTAPIPCQNDTTSYIGSSSVFDCKFTCKKGQYRESYTCIGCPNNTYQMNPENQYSITSCLACPGNTTGPSSSPDKIQCSVKPGFYINEKDELFLCSPGFYCTGVNTTNQTACPPGTYSFVGQTSCMSCLKTGYYCPNASTAPIPCPPNTSNTCPDKPGYYGIPGQFISICPIDHYCTGGSTNPAHCINSFNPANGSTRIEDCVANAGYTGYGNNIMPCPENFFCPKGSIYPFPCPTYSQSPIGSDDVEDCIAVDGYYCN